MSPLSTGRSDPLRSLPPLESESELNFVDSDDDNHSNDYGSTGSASGSASISDDGFCDEAPITTTIATATAMSPTAIMEASAATKSLSNARRLLYVSRGCYHSSELVWGFGSYLWLAELTGFSNLFWISAYQATARVLVIALVPKLSSKIDRRSTATTKTNRSALMSAWIIGQHACVMATVVLIAGTLAIQNADADANAVVDVDVDVDANNSYSEHQQQQLYLSRTGLVLICLCGGLAQVLHNVLEVAVERDWVVIMSEEAERLKSKLEALSSSANPETSIGALSAGTSSSSSSWLQETNVRSRQIYLGCEIFSPLFMGGLLALHGNTALWVVFGLKGCSMAVVYACMRRLYERVPALHDDHAELEVRSPETIHANSNSNTLRGEDDGDGDDSGLLQASIASDEREARSGTSKWCSDLRIYGAQKGLVGAGIGLALLYANVLTFGGMMVGYLVEKGGMSTASIGLWKGSAHGAAFLGTVWFSRSKSNLETKALRSILVQFSCLSISVVGFGIIFFHKHSALGGALVIAGVIPSRIGLWGYDLGVSQLYQERVAPSLRGTVGGTQTLLNNFVEFVPFGMGMISSSVDDFWRIVVVGYACMGLAVGSYVMGTFHYRGQHRELPREDGVRVRVLVEHADAVTGADELETGSAEPEPVEACHRPPSITDTARRALGVAEGGNYDYSMVEMTG